MRIVKAIAGLLILVGGGFLVLPLILSLWISLVRPNDALPPTVEIAGREFAGWQMWTVVGGLALFGALVILIGYYVARPRSHSG